MHVPPAAIWVPSVLAGWNVDPQTEKSNAAGDEKGEAKTPDAVRRTGVSLGQRKSASLSLRTSVPTSAPPDGELSIVFFDLYVLY
jgi:hypothetical protein